MRYVNLTGPYKPPHTNLTGPYKGAEGDPFDEVRQRISNRILIGTTDHLHV